MLLRRAAGVSVRMPTFDEPAVSLFDCFPAGRFRNVQQAICILPFN